MQIGESVAAGAPADVGHRPADDTRQDGGEVLKGRVTYADGTPAARVPFVVITAQGPRRGGYTDSDGRYLVEGVTGQARLSLCDRLPLARTADARGAPRVAVFSSPAEGQQGGGGGTAVV
jgi:hypothetical protein